MIPLSDSTLRRTGYALCVLIGVFAAVAVREYARVGDNAKSIENALLPLTFVAVIMVLLRAVPRHGVLWTLLAFGVVGSLHEGLKLVGTSRLGLSPEDMADTSLAPASLGVVDTLIVNFVSWGWLWLVTLMIPLIVLFPTGRPTNHVARFVLWLAPTATVVASAVGALSLAPWIETPYAELLSADGWLPIVGNLFLGLSLLLAVALGDLAWRFWRSSGIERHQFRWVATALAAFVLSMILPIPLYLLGVEFRVPEVVFFLVQTLALAAIPVSIGIAISRYRLFDIDLVISRTLLFVVMAGLITIVYAGVVVGLGSLVGGSTLGWRIGVTALVAVLFEPIRNRVQRRVNRLVFGRRAAPYEVLATLTGRLATSERDEGLLGRMVMRLAEGTGAERAIVWLADESGFRSAATAPHVDELASSPDPAPARIEDLPGTVVPIVEDGETLGALSVEPRRGVTLTATERRLIEDLAGSAGLTLRRLRLDAELRHQAALLEESRRRLVNAQELERRRLQRRLDEDARQRVVALRTKLDSTAELARREGSVRSAVLMDQMAAETDNAIDQIEALARGLHPPLLEAEGLGAAVAALCESAPIDVHLSAPHLERQPLPAEVAAYFCIAEAVTNALKHGRGPISVVVGGDPAGLAFTVTDSGPGFDPAVEFGGSGLRNMAERVEPFNGSITIDSRPGSSTVISGRIPVKSPALVT